MNINKTSATEISNILSSFVCTSRCVEYCMYYKVCFFMQFRRYEAFGMQCEMDFLISPTQHYKPLCWNSRKKYERIRVNKGNAKQFVIWFLTYFCPQFSQFISGTHCINYNPGLPSLDQCFSKILITEVSVLGMMNSHQIIVIFWCTQNGLRPKSFMFYSSEVTDDICLKSDKLLAFEERLKSFTVRMLIQMYTCFEYE